MSYNWEGEKKWRGGKRNWFRDKIYFFGLLCWCSGNIREGERLWIANMGGQTHGAYEAVALLWEPDTGEAPHDQEML